MNHPRAGKFLSGNWQMPGLFDTSLLRQPLLMERSIRLSVPMRRTCWYRPNSVGRCGWKTARVRGSASAVVTGLRQAPSSWPVARLGRARSSAQPTVWEKYPRIVLSLFKSCSQPFTLGWAWM